jgi:transcriptional regulator with XRE-family HTH domain
MGYRKIEAGESEPRGETLMAIARALDVRVEELLVAVRPLKHVRFRAQKKLHTRDQLLASVARQLDHYEMLEDLLGERPARVLPKLRTAVRKLPAGSRPVEAARLARKALGLSDGDLIRDICGLLEDNGIKVLTPSVATMDSSVCRLPRTTVDPLSSSIRGTASRSNAGSSRLPTS